ncbi:MAG: hypothetical protein FJ026_09685 [Chloroflexi bacterium]|nr:hypothetical protein [Chloroflexota bacterium]
MRFKVNTQPYTIDFQDGNPALAGFGNFLTALAQAYGMRAQAEQRREAMEMEQQERLRAERTAAESEARAEARYVDERDYRRQRDVLGDQEREAERAAKAQADAARRNAESTESRRKAYMERKKLQLEESTLAAKTQSEQGQQARKTADRHRDLWDYATKQSTSKDALGETVDEARRQRLYRDYANQEGLTPLDPARLGGVPAAGAGSDADTAPGPAAGPVTAPAGFVDLPDDQFHEDARPVAAEVRGLMRVAVEGEEADRKQAIAALRDMARRGDRYRRLVEMFIDANEGQ